MTYICYFVGQMVSWKANKRKCGSQLKKSWCWPSKIFYYNSKLSVSIFKYQFVCQVASVRRHSISWSFTVSLSAQGYNTLLIFFNAEH